MANSETVDILIVGSGMGGATAAAGLAGFPLLDVDTLVGQALCDRLVDAVNSSSDPTARGSDLGDYGTPELGAGALQAAAGIPGARGRDQLVKLVLALNQNVE